MVFHEVDLPDFRIFFGSFRGKIPHASSPSTSSLTGNRRERRLERESLECLRKNGGDSGRNQLQHDAPVSWW